MNELKRNQHYNAYVEAKLPKTHFISSLAKAFFVGGIICVFGQLFFDLYSYFFPNLSENEISACMLITIIVITQFLTAIGVYDKIGAFGGAGSVIPITGYANSMCSPALEFKREGIIYGICVKIFTIAGPVIVIGIVGSVIVGLIYFII